jgi:uncharacterized protein (DUF952 family)
VIYHLVTREEWSAATRAGSYAPPSLAAEGFIHCSTLGQLVATANAFFRDNRDLVVLCIEESRLGAPLRFETPADASDARALERFPHLYGPLDPGVVARVVDFPCTADGTFKLPAALAGR